MNKTLLACLPLAAILISTGCKKETNLNGGIEKTVAYVSLTNASPSSKQINILIDGNKVNIPSQIAPYATTTGTYVGVAPGTRALIARDTTTASTIDYFTGNIAVNAGTSYSFFVYDTLIAGKMKGLLLTTDRSADETGKSRVRFLNLSPKSPELDFVLVRRVGGVAADSVTLFRQQAYVGGSTPNTVALSAFTSVNASQPAGATTGSAVTDYIIRAKIFNTNTIVASTAATTLVNGRNYTIFARGIYPTVTLTTLINN